MAAVGSAAALALAGIFSFAAVVIGFTAAFALARVLAFTGVNVFLVIVTHLIERNARFARDVCGVRLDGERTTHQPGNCSAREDSFRCHFFFFFGVFYPYSEI